MKFYTGNMLCDSIFYTLLQAFKESGWLKILFDKHNFAPIQEDVITEKIEILKHYLNVKNFNFIIKKNEIIVLF